jgi:hypothetical protein
LAISAIYRRIVALPFLATQQAVARIVLVLRRQGSRIGTLAGRKYRMGEDFDDPVKNSSFADDFGVPRV